MWWWVCGGDGLSKRTLGHVGSAPEKREDRSGMMKSRSNGRRDCNAAMGDAGGWLAWLCGLLLGLLPPIWCSLTPGPPPMLKTKPFPPPVQPVLVGGWVFSSCRSCTYRIRQRVLHRSLHRPYHLQRTVGTALQGLSLPRTWSLHHEERVVKQIQRTAMRPMKQRHQRSAIQDHRHTCRTWTSCPGQTTPGTLLRPLQDKSACVLILRYRPASLYTYS